VHARTRGTRSGRHSHIHLKKLAHHVVAQNWEAVQPGVEVTRCRSPEGTEETVVLGRSAGRKENEHAILNRFVIRLEHQLVKLAEQAAAGRARDHQNVERQIGRVLERHSRAAALFTGTVNAGRLRKRCTPLPHPQQE